MYIKNELKAGINNPCVLKDGYKQFVEKNIDIKVDYISIADQISLEEVKTITSLGLEPMNFHTKPSCSTD